MEQSREVHRKMYRIPNPASPESSKSQNTRHLSLKITELAPSNCHRRATCSRGSFNLRPVSRSRIFAFWIPMKVREKHGPVTHRRSRAPPQLDLRAPPRSRRWRPDPAPVPSSRRRRTAARNRPDSLVGHRRRNCRPSIRSAAAAMYGERPGTRRSCGSSSGRTWTGVLSGVVCSDSSERLRRLSTSRSGAGWPVPFPPSTLRDSEVNGRTLAACLRSGILRASWPEFRPCCCDASLVDGAQCAPVSAKAGLPSHVGREPSRCRLTQL